MLISESIPEGNTIVDSWINPVSSSSAFTNAISDATNFLYMDDFLLTD